VILKEVYLLDLGAAERQMALNEAKILSMLDHPNIVSYFDCFEQVWLVGCLKNANAHPPVYCRMVCCKSKWSTLTAARSISCSNLTVRFFVFV
jgi:serine/threonine protein kinase